MMMMYQVGQRVAQFMGPDGVFLSIDESGALLLCRMARPTSPERRAFNSGQPIKISMGEMGGIMFWTVGFGELPLMDCTYSPQIAPSRVHLVAPPEGKGYALTVILADGENGEVQKLRLVGLPHDTSVAMREIIERISGETIDYQRSLRSIYQLSTTQLDELAAVRCVIVGG